MNTHDGYNRMLDWYESLPRKNHSDGSMIDVLEKRILLETDAEALQTLRFLLAGEYAAHGRNEDAESLCWTLHRECPDDPMPLISLASKTLYCRNRPQEAMPIIDQAIDIANRSQTFRRFALGAKARIALELHDYSIVEDVLKQLMKLKLARGNIDCGIERDFFDRLPRGVIDENVAREYDKFSQSAKRR